jgi:nucleoid-associated protein YgaU
MNRTSVRLRRRAALRLRRLARTLFVATAVASGLGFLAGHATARAERTPPRAVRVYVVRPGDTLWGIAAGVAGPGADPRPVVDALISVNHVSNGVITPGQRLRLPATGG